MRRFLWSIGFLVVLPVFGAGVPAGAAEPPNVLFFLADDLGWMDLGCYGSDYYESPTIDRLASQGVRFTHAYTAGTVCSPTRASILTGQTPARHGCTQYGGRIAGATHIGLGKALQETGYETFFVGKWHIGGWTPEAAGFQVAEEISARGKRARNDPKSTRRITDSTLAFLRQLDHERPFFAYVSYHAVHLPLRENAQLVSKYRDKRSERPLQTKGPAGLERERDRDNKQVQDLPEYAAMVEGIDTSVKRILACLEELDLRQRTIVVFTSDNGGLSTKPCTSNLPLRAGKGWAYEGGIRVPLIVQAPGVTPAGRVVSTPVTSMDFYPTLLTLAGADLLPVQHRDGINLTDLLQGKSPPASRTLFWHYPHDHGAWCIPVGALRNDRYKLVHWFREDRYELYDLREDPSELTDLARDRPGLVGHLASELKAWQGQFERLSFDEPGK